MPSRSSASPARVRRRPARVVPVPKPGGGVRWMAHLDPGDELGFAVAVGGVAGCVEAALGHEVIANRLEAVGSPEGLRLQAFVPAHARWRGRLARALAEPKVRVVLRTDVADCYPSIEPAVVERALLETGASPAWARTAARLLERWGEEGVRGLPVGPAPSAVLANVVLRAADDALREVGVAHLRWVDDVVAFARDRRTAVRGHDAFRRALDTLGLRPNESKTALLEGRAEAVSALRARGSTTPGSAVR